MSKIAQLEALLFYYGEAITFKKISSLLEIKELDVVKLVEELQKKLEEDENRGLYLIVNDKVQLLTKPETSQIIQKIMKDEFREELSPASLETLSIIAYLGPITRPAIDFIRGVNSSFTTRNLLLRGLIERKSGKGHAYEYVPSIQFLSHLGIKNVLELPEYKSYKEIFEQFKKIQSEEKDKDLTDKENQEILIKNIES